MISKNNYKITIIIPVFNTERYLSECIESVLVQIYENKEILIINDGSTDGSKVIIEKYNKSYSCIRVFET